MWNFFYYFQQMGFFHTQNYYVDIVTIITAFFLGFGSALRTRRRLPNAQRRNSVPNDQSPERVGLETRERRRVAPKTRHAARRRPRERAAQQRVQAREMDRPGPSGRQRPDKVRLRLARARARQQQARDSRHAAVQAARVRHADQPEYGQRVGDFAVHRRHRHEAEGRKVFDYEGPE